MELLKDTATTATGAGDAWRRLSDGTWKRLRDGLVMRCAETRGTVVLLTFVRKEETE